MRIENKVMPASKVMLDDLHPFQGELKTLSVANYEKLKKEISDTGFSFTLHYWTDPQSKIKYILDGHQRLATIRKMVDEDGYECDGVMAAEVLASDVREAKRKLLAAVSQYGKVTGDGLYEYLHESGLDAEMLKNNFEIPGIDINNFLAEFFDASVDLPQSMDWDEATEHFRFVIKCDSEEELSILKEYFKTQKDSASYAQWRSTVGP